MADVTLLFCALPAYVGRVDSLTRYGVWTELPVHVGNDPERLIPINVDREPSLAMTLKLDWRQVEVDSVRPEGLSSLAPAAIHGAKEYVYVEDKYLKHLGKRYNILNTSIYYFARDYEFQMVLEATKNVDANGDPVSYSVVRYLGFHGKLSAAGDSFFVYDGGSSLDSDAETAHRHGPFEVAVLQSADCQQSYTKLRPARPEAAAVTEEVVFLSTAWAHTNNVLGPKLPPSAGQFTVSNPNASAEDGQDPCAAFAHGRINICGPSHDRAMVVLRGAIENKSTVAGIDELEQLLERLDECPDKKGISTLDLITHSRYPDYALVFGSWSLTHDAQLQAFLDRYKKILCGDLGIQRLRLLGCRTACGQVATDLLAFLSNQLQIPALGTQDVFDWTDFGPEGLLDDAVPRLSTGQPNPMPLRWPRGPRVEVDLSRLTALPSPIASWPQVKQSHDVISSLTERIDGDWRSIPGILALPRAQILIRAEAPSEGGPELYHRMDVLLSHELLRVIPIDQPDGAVCRIKDASEFELFFQGLT